MCLEFAALLGNRRRANTPIYLHCFKGEWRSKNFWNFVWILLEDFFYSKPVFFFGDAESEIIWGSGLPTKTISQQELPGCSKKVKRWNGETEPGKGFKLDPMSMVLTLMPMCGLLLSGVLLGWMVNVNGITTGIPGVVLLIWPIWCLTNGIWLD